jgi:hypothetical protein
MQIVKYFYGDRTPMRIEEYHPKLGFTVVGHKRLPVVTVCGIFDEDSGILRIGIARCSEKDVFVKKIGKELSYDRATTNPHMIVNLKPGAKFSPIFYDLSHYLSQRLVTNKAYKSHVSDYF